MILYLDASALVKRYVTERGSRETADVCAKAEIVATSLVSRAEVAAALALPVVGVIPAMASTSTPARTATRPLVRGTIVVGEIVAAFLVFTLVAYGLQNPAAIWQFCTDPLEAVRRAGDALGGN